VRGLEVAGIIGGGTRAGKRNRPVNDAPVTPARPDPLARAPAPADHPRMIYLLLTPAVLSLLVLAAHFLRQGNVVVCAIHLGMALTLSLRHRPWVPRFMQVFLAIGLVVWGFALSQFVHERQALGEPTGRLVVILGSVMAVNALAIVLMGTRAVRARYAPPPATPGANAEASE
jgi:hypothetical protein